MQWVVNVWIMWPISFCRGRQYEQVQKGARHSWTKSLEMDTRRTKQYTLQHPWYNSFGGVKHKWRAESDQTERFSVNNFSCCLRVRMLGPRIPWSHPGSSP